MRFFSLACAKLLRFLLLGKIFISDLCIFFHCLFRILIEVIRLIKWRLNKDLLFSLFPTRKINTKVPVKLTRKINSEKRKQPSLKRKIALNILDPALYQNKKKVKVVGDTMYFSMSPSQCWKWPVMRPKIILGDLICLELCVCLGDQLRIYACTLITELCQRKLVVCNSFYDLAIVGAKKFHEWDTYTIYRSRLRASPRKRMLICCQIMHSNYQS